MLIGGLLASHACMLCLSLGSYNCNAFFLPARCDVMVSFSDARSMSMLVAPMCDRLRNARIHRFASTPVYAYQLASCSLRRSTVTRQPLPIRRPYVLTIRHAPVLTDPHDTDTPRPGLTDSPQPILPIRLPTITASRSIHSPRPFKPI